MIKYCDYCRKLIIPTDGEIEDSDEIWNKEYKKRMKIELLKRKGIKKFFYRVFCFPDMPFYPSDEFQFCSGGCYDAWKKKAKSIFALEKEGEQ